MVEVFKTDVKKKEHANMLIDQIHTIFREYKVNIDADKYLINGQSKMKRLNLSTNDLI